MWTDCQEIRKFSLKEVSFRIPKGYIMGFIGRNGAGKSTRHQVHHGPHTLEAGTIEAFGLDSRRCSDEIRRRVGYVSEEQHFYEKCLPAGP